MDLTVSKDQEREYGLCVKHVRVYPACELREEWFSSPRVAGEAKMNTFEVNVRVMKGMQSNGNGLTDFFRSDKHFTSRPPP